LTGDGSTGAWAAEADLETTTDDVGFGQSVCEGCLGPGIELRVGVKEQVNISSGRSGAGVQLPTAAWCRCHDVGAHLGQFGGTVFATSVCDDDLNGGPERSDNRVEGSRKFHSLVEGGDDDRDGEARLADQRLIRRFGAF